MTIIIIGSGLAGLYAAYLLKKSNIDFIILEKADRVGGRVLNADFHGHDIPLGAGVGRKDKDHLLLQLLKDLKMKINTGVGTHTYGPGIHKQPSFTIYNKIKNAPSFSRMKFETFGKQIMGSKNYKDFVAATGYSDYEKMDHIDVIQHYGMEDNMEPLNMIYIPWNELLDKLVKFIGEKHMRYNTEVIRLDGTTAYCKNKRKYVGDKVICAGTIMTLRKLFHNRIYREIAPQPFLRVYVKCSESSYEPMKKHINGVTIVRTPLQKIIPMNPDKGLYMIAYSDNESAKVLHNYIKMHGKKKTHELLEAEIHDLFKIKIEIKDSVYRYWPVGTHYYKPLPKQYTSREEFIEKAQRPRDNVYVVGEVVALEQGWCEGALDSVHQILY